MCWIGNKTDKKKSLKNIYKIFINETTPETQGNLVIEAGIFQAHLKPIVGTVVNFINGYIYTMARECVIKIFDINYQNFDLILLRNLLYTFSLWYFFREKFTYFH